MPTTSNFGWTTPADTDLVKDGAAAIRTLGNGIDTSLLDLKGGTSGQVLSKNSNTDLDYTWITPNVGDITEVQAGVGISVASGTGPIPIITNSSTDLITTAGDLLYGTAADTVARLGIGTASQILAVNSGATAPEWVTPAAGGGMTLIATATPSAATGVQFASIATTYKTLLLVWDLCKDPQGANGYQQVKLNNDSSGLYSYAGLVRENGLVWYEVNNDTKFGNSTSQGPIPRLSSSGSAYHQMGNGFMYIYNANQTTDTKRVVWSSTGMNDGDGASQGPIQFNGVYRGTSAISQIDFFRTSTNTLTGTIRLYGLS